MSQDSGKVSPVFRIDVSADSPSSANDPTQPTSNDMLLRQLVVGQQQTNKILTELVQQTVAIQKQRVSELQQWKDANPELTRACRRAAETLSRVQTQFLENLTEEITENEESLVDGEFMLNEFVDRFGPRLAHLNGVLQVLAQLGSGVPVEN
ncbi:hypothetical protein FF011L_29660 [Roseimaritima multifibrata]|uniref:Uncharacterized protein n=1 Tax=Roseimaritima multifibrata TaxID=1930274 RepID=A0A517MH30_9BACT|nr:hypothetical protein [Roseimaritima multifibrata]QDS94188.1 hypothetical protein FF011L_29660 [Roseimaritima multifibrata]